jgi:hypothetical protein
MSTTNPLKKSLSPIKKAFVNLLKQNDLQICNDNLNISNDNLKISNDNLKICNDNLQKKQDDLNKCYENMDIESFKYSSKADRNYYLQENTNAFVKDLFDEILQKSNLIRLLIDENHSLRKKCKQYNIQYNTKNLDDLIESLKESELNHEILK